MKKYLTNQASSLLLSLIFLSGCISIEQQPVAFQTISPKNGDVISLLNDEQLKFLDMPYEVRRVKFDEPEFRKELVNKCGWYPTCVQLLWTNNCNNCSVEVFRVSKNGGRKAISPVCVGAFSAVLDNLEIASTYEWVVKCGDKALTNSFMTADRAPRLIHSPKVPNVRDLGGRIGLGGHRIKQGRIYRSAGLNDNAYIGAHVEKSVAFNADASGALRTEEAEILAMIKALRDGEEKVRLVPYKLAETWTCMRDDDKIVKVLAPETNHVVSLRNERGGVGNLGFFEVVLTAEDNGYVALRCGADWYWNLTVNGIQVFNKFVGNGLVLPEEQHLVVVPVKKGENLLKATVLSGSINFLFYLKEGEDTLTDEEAKNVRIANLESLSENFFNKPEFFGRHIGKSRISDENRDLWLKELGIKTDIDLRNDTECYEMTGSPLGETVKWEHISSKAYVELDSDEGRKQFAKSFRVMLNEENYPIDFHCIAGQDRTGSLAFVLNAILGVADEELIRDWEATVFWNPECGWFCHKWRFDPMWELFQSFPGTSTMEKCIWYVKSCGFTDADIEHFRSIMLEND